jgi:hypothetical protein
MLDLSQIEAHLGSYTTNPSAYVKQFQYLLQSYSLTYHDIYIILSNTLLPKECRRVWEQASSYTDEVHQITPVHPTGALAMPDHDPNWDYNTQARLTLRDQFATCLLAGLKWASQKAINFEKLQEIIQDRTENPSTFRDRLTRALQQYTNIDPESTDSRQLLMTYFFFLSYPDIRAKLKKLDRGPLNPQTEVLATAFKVFHTQDEKAKCQKYQMLAQAMRGPGAGPTWDSQSLSAGHPLGFCYHCGGEGHWAKACPNPKPPPWPCPRCHAPGHWVIDHPGSWRGVGSASHSIPDLIGLAMDN